jgi:hypothetical protein
VSEDMEVPLFVAFPAVIMLDIVYSPLISSAASGVLPSSSQAK